MKIGVHYRGLGAEVPYEQGFPFLADCGAAGVELILREGTALHEHTSINRLYAIRRLAADCGLAISGLTNAYLWDYPLTSDNPQTRRRGLDSLQYQISAAQALGTQRLLVIPGYAGTDYIKSSQRVRYDVAMNRVYEGLAAAVPLAQQAGVALCVENVWNRLLLSPLELQALVDAFASPHLGLYFDTGNALLYGDPDAWIELLGKRILAVHLKDALRSRADVSAYVPLGEGDADFQGILAALRRVDYQGYYTLEKHQDWGFEPVRRELAVMKRLLHAEENKGGASH